MKAPSSAALEEKRRLVFQQAGLNSAAKRELKKQQRRKGAYAAAASRVKKKALYALDDLFAKPLKSGLFGVPQPHSFDEKDLAELGVSLSDIAYMRNVEFVVCWDLDDKSRICIEAVLPLPRCVVDLLDEPAQREQRLIAKLLVCAWRKSAKIIGNTGPYECLDDAFLRDLNEVYLDRAFSVIYDVEESVFREWRELSPDARDPAQPQPPLVFSQPRTLGRFRARSWFFG